MENFSRLEEYLFQVMYIILETILQGN